VMKKKQFNQNTFQKKKLKLISHIVLVSHLIENLLLLMMILFLVILWKVFLLLKMLYIMISDRKKTLKKRSLHYPGITNSSKGIKAIKCSF